MEMSNSKTTVVKDVIHFQELQESICHIWDNVTQTKINALCYLILDARKTIDEIALPMRDINNLPLPR
jgi:hypothetical protein